MATARTSRGSVQRSFLTGADGRIRAGDSAMGAVTTPPIAPRHCVPVARKTLRAWTSAWVCRDGATCPPIARRKSAVYTARRAADVTLAPKRRIKMTALKRRVHAAGMLRERLDPTFVGAVS